MELKIDYTPTKKQAMFHASAADEVLFGGAAGGGKSMAIVMEALMKCIENSGTTAYIFRRTYRELEDVILPLIRQFVPQSLGSYDGNTKSVRLVNGSQIRLRHCFSDSDRYRYQGAEIHFLFIDELTHFPKDIFDYLKSRLRAPNRLHIKPYVRCTSNPGGIGHAWVKQYFVDNGPYDIVKKEIVSEVLHKSRSQTIQYIPALVTDNPYISEDYIFELEQKPQSLKNALLHGAWDAFEGQVFSEWRNEPEAYGTGIYTHVIDPFEIPKNWPRYRSFDFGYAKPFSVLWWAIGYDGTAYLYREWYGACADNVGIKISAREIAKGIREIEQQCGEEVTGFADPSIWDGSRGESIADQIANEGVFFFPGDNARIAGKMQFHYRLAFNDEGKPGMYVFSDCKEFIRCIPALCYDEYKVEDVDTRGEDHCYDAARYFLMSRPVAPVKKEHRPRSINPLKENRTVHRGFMDI